MKQAQLATMIEMQESMNLKVHADWRSQEFNWHRAIWLEAAEALEHCDWKWWKKGATDTEQLKMELVDIWHFILSAHAQRGTVPQSYKPEDRPEADVKICIESLALCALNNYTDSMTRAFFSCLYAIDMSFDELFQLYVGKNVLNMFRQDNGYKSGTYSKVWGDLEDNQHLTKILAYLDSEADNYQKTIYETLQRSYNYGRIGVTV